LAKIKPIYLLGGAAVLALIFKDRILDTLFGKGKNDPTGGLLRWKQSPASTKAMLGQSDVFYY
jgi:hypothetical protein